jgi:tetratricopeptide (TPR) repeat protein
VSVDVLVVVVTLLLIGVLVLLGRSSNPAQQLAKAQKLLGEGRRKAARKRFARAMALAKAGKGKAGERSGIIGRASLSLGELEESSGNPEAAFAHYATARAAGAQLGPGAIRLMAERYARTGATGDQVALVYVAYLELPPPRSETVLSALSAMCQVTEEMKPPQRKAAAEWNRRVIAVDSGIEWAHYYYGLASFLDGRNGEALEALTRAATLSQARPLTFYWLGVCHLQQAEPDLDAAAAAIDRFLSFPSAGGKGQKREARACNELGKRLVAKLGGFDAKEPCSGGERRARLARAIHYLEAATARQSDASYWFDLGRAHALCGATDSAVGAFQNAALAAPREKLYAYLLGVERNRAGDRAGAVAALRKAVEIDGKYAEALVLLAEILLGQGEYAAAEPHCRALRKLNKADASCLALLLRALYGQGKYAEAVSEAAGAPPFFLTPQKHPEAIFVVGRSYAQVGKFAEAAGWLEGLRQQPRGLYYLACAQAHCGQLAEARACFETLTAGSHEYAVRALVQRGHVLLAQGNAAEAEKSYLQAVERSGENVDALYGLGVLAYEAEEYQTAAPRFARALSAAPSNTRTRFALGVALERQGQLPQALAAYMAIPIGEPCGPAAALRAGVVNCRLGCFPQVLECLAKIAPLGEDGNAFLLYRGTALILSGRLEEGMADWTKLQSRNPGNERVALNIVRAYYMLGARELTAGNYPAALAAWEEYLRLYPSDEKTARDVAEIHYRLAAAELGREGGPNTEKAALHLRQAVERNGANPEYSYCLALVDLRAGNYSACAAALQQLIGTAGRQPRLTYHLALCLLHTGQTEQAAQLLAEVKSAAGADGYGRYAAWALANEHVRQGRPELAAQELAPVAAAPAVAARSGK